MEFEDRNKKPEEPAKNLPMAVLITLVGIVCLLLYVGWQMISDDASNVSDLSPKTSVVDEPEPIDNVDSVDEEIVETEQPVSEPVKAPESKIEDSKKAPVRIEAAKLPSGSKTATHKISKGETLFSIATRYNLSLNTLKAANPGISAENLKGGANLTIPVLTIHVVGPGDILRVVGGKYGVTVKAIMEANGKSKNFAERGEKLIIPFKDKQ